MPYRFTDLAGLGLAGTLVLAAGCGTGRAPAAPEHKPQDASGEEDPAIGKPAPPIAVQAVDHKGAISLAALRGQVVIAHFWSSKDVDCSRSLAMLESMSRRMDRKIEVIGISVGDEDDERAAAFARTHGVSFTIASDPRRTVANAWKVEAAPTTFIIDAEGVVRHVHHGHRERDSVVILNEVSMLTESIPAATKARADDDDDKDDVDGPDDIPKVSEAVPEEAKRGDAKKISRPRARAVAPKKEPAPPPPRQRARVFENGH